MSRDKSVRKDEELLVVAMARPAMIGGFTMTSLGVSCYLPTFTALLTRSLWPLLLLPVFLLVSYLVCLKDVYLFDIANSATRLKPCRNKRYWGCRSYAPR